VKLKSRSKEVTASRGMEKRWRRERRMDPPMEARTKKAEKRV